MHKYTFSIALLILALASVGLSGCSGEANPLIGTWTLDAETMKQTDEYKSATPEEQQQMVAMVSMMTLELTFTEDEILSKTSIMGESKEEKDAYVIQKRDGDHITIASTNNEGEKDVAEAHVKGDVLEMSSEGSPVLILKRK